MYQSGFLRYRKLRLGRDIWLGGIGVKRHGVTFIWPCRSDTFSIFEAITCRKLILGRDIA